jgi:hypothetical protein
MAQSTYPKPVAEVVETLTDICRHQKRSELVELLQSAHAHFDATNYDNWNGGTTTWALRLEVPTLLFAIAQQRLADIEKELADKLLFLDRLFPNDPLGEVSITPVTSSEMALGQRMAPSEIDVRRLWKDGYLRLFLSHVSRHKAKVARLKDELLKYGVSAFVAHEDIEPNLEWQNEISLALRSMHALAALVTDDFHSSNWTDQELGWALGRGVPVLPVRLGADPYGFVGKIQAVSGTLEDVPSLALNIVKALLRSDLIRGHMKRALVEAFECSDSFATAKLVKNVLVTVEDFSEDEKERIRQACKMNSQVSGSFGVASAINRTFGEPKPVEVTADDVAF